MRALGNVTGQILNSKTYVNRGGRSVRWPKGSGSMKVLIADDGATLTPATHFSGTGHVSSAAAPSLTRTTRRLTVSAT
jgi:hypothetical protein